MTKNNQLIEGTGIVSEIRIGTLLNSDNEFLACPVRVVVHVMERGVDGRILQCTVNTGEGAFVLARNAKFSDLSKPLPFRYQHLNAAAVLKSDPWFNTPKLIKFLENFVNYHNDKEFAKRKEENCAEITDGCVSYLDCLTNIAEGFLQDLKGK